MKTLILRGEVQQFARAMERRLQKHDPRNPRGPTKLGLQLSVRVAKLSQAVERYVVQDKKLGKIFMQKRRVRSSRYDAEKAELDKIGREVVRKAADVGNVAMVFAGATDELK